MNYYTIECNVALDKNIFQMHSYKNKGLDLPVTSYFFKIALEYDHCYAHHCFIIILKLYKLSQTSSTLYLISVV